MSENKYSSLSDEGLEGLKKAKRNYITGLGRIFNFLTNRQKEDIYSAFSELQDIEEEQERRKEDKK